MTRIAASPVSWWARQSLRARLTLLATALFSLAVLTGTVLVLVLQRYTLVRTLDSSALKTAHDIALQVKGDKSSELTTVLPTTGGIAAVQVVDRTDRVLAVSPGSDRVVPILDAKQLAQVREGDRIALSNAVSDAPERALGVRVGDKTVVVITDLKNVNDSVRLLGQVALIGGPLAVLLLALATYGVVALTLRSVAALRHGAADITAAGLADQRLPLPSAQDEIHRLAVTLNAMLDRIDASTTRQRTFVGDAAHELRSPLASLRVQLEVAKRVGPETDLESLVDDVLVDVDRLDRLVYDLLALARSDEAAGRLLHAEPVNLPELLADLVGGYESARVPVELDVDVAAGAGIVNGDIDGLRRVGINLIDNAVRYASARVTVSVESDSSSTLTMLVTDDGRGIPADERERVFDRFYRVQASRSRGSGGTGLGLSIVRDVVRAHGGSVRLAARPDGKPGLQAIVVLPRLG
ncbi:MAG TPA: ATP-binding protein [Jatrophihabitantaceae bacterium]|nr:ATP-binding protein [Jatrophihabitantaceae bacterium]